MYTRPGQDQIYTRITADMRTRVTSNTPILKFSLLGILAKVFTGAIHLVYGALAVVLKQLFVDTATGEYLDRHANLYNLPRKAASFATGTLNFSGTDGATIPEGTQVQDENGILYDTTEEKTIVSGSAIVPIQAEEAGTGGNSSSATFSLVAALADVDTQATPAENPNGGQDLETDEQLRYRLKLRIQNPPKGGTVADYESWALEIPGVGNAWIKPADKYAGAGTVGIVIATAELGTVDPSVKTETQDYIDSSRVAGIRSDVLDPIILPTDFSIKISPYTENFRTNITEALENLIISEAEPGGTLLLTHIQSAISGTGVEDYTIESITVDGTSNGVGNISTDNTQLLNLGVVSYQEL